MNYLTTLVTSVNVELLSSIDSNANKATKRATSRGSKLLSAEPSDAQLNLGSTLNLDFMVTSNGLTNKLTTTTLSKSKSTGTLTKSKRSTSSVKVWQCSQCVCKQAALWCSQCAAAYCGICWLRSPAHTKTNIFPVQSNGPKPPYFSVDAFSESTHVRQRITPEGIDAIDPPQTESLPRTASSPSSHGLSMKSIQNELRTYIPPRRSQNFLTHHHEFDRKPAKKPEDLTVVKEYRDYPLPPVFLDSAGTVHHFETRAEIRPSTTPDFRMLRSSNGRRAKVEELIRSVRSLPHHLHESRHGTSEDGTKSVGTHSPTVSPGTPSTEGRPGVKLLIFNSLRSKSPSHQSPTLSTPATPAAVGEAGDPADGGIVPGPTDTAKDSSKPIESREFSPHSWIVRKRPLQIKSEVMANAVGAAFSIGGRSGSAIQVAYSASPSTARTGRLDSPKAVHVTDWAHEGGLETNQRSSREKMSASSGRGTNGERSVEILNGKIVYMKQPGRGEKEIMEENLLREIRKQEEAGSQMHPRAFRLP